MQIYSQQHKRAFAVLTNESIHFIVAKQETKAIHPLKIVSLEYILELIAFIEHLTNYKEKPKHTLE